jgi:hypothetical protein
MNTAKRLIPTVWAVSCIVCLLCGLLLGLLIPRPTALPSTAFNVASTDETSEEGAEQIMAEQAVPLSVLFWRRLRPTVRYKVCQVAAKRMAKGDANLEGELSEEFFDVLSAAAFNPEIDEKALDWMKVDEVLAGYIVMRKMKPPSFGTAPPAAQ